MEDPRQLILADQNLRDIKPVMNADIDFAVGSDENDYEIKSGAIGGISGIHTEIYSTLKIQSSEGLSEEKR